MNDLTRLAVSALLVDARGKACPLPIVELARALRTAPMVELWATDPATRGDLEAFLDATGHTRRSELVHPGAYQAVIEKRV